MLFGKYGKGSVYRNFMGITILFQIILLDIVLKPYFICITLSYKVAKCGLELAKIYALMTICLSGQVKTIFVPLQIFSGRTAGRKTSKLWSLIQ